MKMVLLTALGVGGATLIGAIIGFVVGKVSHRISDIILGFAAGVMLSAAVMGLIIPSMESGSVVVTVVGIFCGAVVLNLIDKLMPHLHNLSGGGEEKHPASAEKLNKILLFVLAIAIHNFPEGIAAGVGFGSGNTADALTIAGGIALQNIPEGMVIIAPMLAAGISRRRTLLIASATGAIEVVGTLIGYFVVNISAAVLPFALAFAGGTMLYIISDEMIPETHAHGSQRGATYAILTGFCLMLVMDVLIGG
ncbi:MAG: ZIP family metal transporter [Ruminococcaceae bacterium]|nr:ZIP family metal transporter [Oscillospiraceae bacterium]